MSKHIRKMHTKSETKGNVTEYKSRNSNIKVSLSKILLRYSKPEVCCSHPTISMCSTDDFHVSYRWSPCVLSPTSLRSPFPDPPYTLLTLQHTPALWEVTEQCQLALLNYLYHTNLGDGGWRDFALEKNPVSLVLILCEEPNETSKHWLRLK